MNRTKIVLGIFRKIAVLLWWGVTVLVMVFIIGIMAAKIKGEIPYFFGYSIMNIVSGSMEDTIPEGSYILIKKTDPADIRKGDIICFYSDDPAISGFPNTHTVIEEPIYGENGIEFVTKGDANPEKDDVTAKGDKLIGKYVTNLDALTKLNDALQGNGMFIFSIVLPGLCAVCMIASIFLKLSEKDRDDDSGSQANETQADQSDNADPQA